MEADRMDVETPEHVQLSYELAGIGSRFLAAMMDLILQGLVFVLLIIAFAWLESLFPGMIAANRAFFAVVFGGSVFLFLGYYVLFEMLWNGQTPGKRAAGIRVLRDDGTPITLTESLLRNILRTIDFLPVVYGVGLLVVMLNRQNKRLGDLAAGTVVIKEHIAEDLPVPPPPGGARAEEIAALTPLLTALTERDETTIEQFMERRDELAPDLRAHLAARLAAIVEGKLQQRPPALARDPERLLEQVYQALLLRRHQL